MNVAARLPDRHRRPIACRAWSARPTCRCSRSPRRRSSRSPPRTSCSASRRSCGSRVVIVNHERIEVPRMFWPLAAYAGATLVASLFSVDPGISFADCKQLLLFAIVPIAYRLFRGERSLTAVDVVITVGALNAVYGIVQYGILDFDNVAQARAGQPRALHDLLRGHHAGGLHRGGARHVPAPRSDLGRARPAGGARRPRPDAQPQRLGRRVRRHRHAVPAQGSPIGVPHGRVAAGRARPVHRLRAGADHRPVLFDAVAQGHLRRQRNEHVDACSRTATGWR